MKKYIHTILSALVMFLVLCTNLLAQPCINMDFEQGTLNGWTVATNAGGNVFTTTPGTDNIAPAVNRVFNGNFSACLDAIVGGSNTTASLRQTFLVTPQNANFLFNVAVILNSGPHLCNENPGFSVFITNPAGQTIPCSAVNLISTGTTGPCSAFNGWTQSNNLDILNWTPILVPLQAFIGTVVTLNMRVNRCVFGGHGARAYIESSCQPRAIVSSSPVICNGRPVTLSVPNLVGFNFSWVGPNGFTANTPSITASAPGPYSVTINNPTNGCTVRIDTVAVSVASPTASISHTVTPCSPTSSVAVLSTSLQDPTDPISNYDWNWGDATANGNTIGDYHLYGSYGAKSISLTVTSQYGCTDNITQNFFLSSKPVADFSTVSHCFGVPSTFTNSSTSLSAYASQVWNYDDGTPFGIGTSPPHTYFTPGTYNVKLALTDVNTCTDSITKQIIIYPNPIISYSAAAACLNAPTTFVNSTTISAPDNVPIWQWDLDNNGTDDNFQENPVYNFVGTGSKTVKLTAISNKGCSATLINTVVINANPTAAFAPVSACQNLNIALNNTSSIPAPDNIISWNWDFGADASPYTSILPNPTLSYLTSGSKLITLVVTAQTGCTTTISQTVTSHPDPSPEFTFINTCINTQPFNLDASSSYITTGNIATYAWAYGDATSGNGLQTSHAYAAAQVYNVNLTATSDNGCIKSIIKQVEVYEKPKMSILSSAACDRKAMTFTATTLPSSGNVVARLWDFNTGITTIETNNTTSSYVFPVAGNQTVTLVSVTDNDCRDTVYKQVYVDYLPQPDFSVDKPKGCPLPHAVVFTDLTPAVTAPGVNVTWQWEFGDGTNIISTTNSVQNHNYTNTSSSQSALYDVKLIVKTDKGCVDSLTKNAFITVYPKPVAQYFTTPKPADVLSPLIYYTNTSKDYTKWKWYFGESKTEVDSVNQNPTHFYNSATANSYNSILIVENQYGCSDTAYQPVEIMPAFTFYIPNAFTPTDNDNINRTFTGKGIGIEKYEMWIYDRWGNSMYYTDDINKGWDGTVQGKSEIVQQDVYVWKVKLKDVLNKQHNYVGHVTLLK